jgi:hypothetical protein
MGVICNVRRPWSCRSNATAAVRSLRAKADGGLGGLIGCNEGDQRLTSEADGGLSDGTPCHFGLQTRLLARLARSVSQVRIFRTTLWCFRLKELQRMCSTSSQNHRTDWIICSRTDSGSVIDSKGGLWGPSSGALIRKGPATISSPGDNQFHQREGQTGGFVLRRFRRRDGLRCRSFEVDQGPDRNQRPVAVLPSI